MAMWRSPAVESALGASLDDEGLTEEVLKRRVREGVRESEQLDFKLNPHLSASRAEVPVSKKASGQGGVILIGIEEKDEVATGATPTVTDPGAVEQRLRNAVVGYATRAPRFQCIVIPASTERRKLHGAHRAPEPVSAACCERTSR